MTSDKFQKPKEIPPLKKTKYDSPVTKYVIVKKNPLYLKIEKKVLTKLKNISDKRKTDWIIQNSRHSSRPAESSASPATARTLLFPSRAQPTGQT